MPFSVGIGDVIAVGKLIKDITDSLRSAGGAKSEYQELTKELEALKAALDGLDQLDSSTAPSALLDTIKFIAADCRQRLEVFWAKIERYGSSLGPASQSNALRSTMDKLGWTFFQKEEVVQLQRNLQSYSNVINILMIRHVAGQVQDMRKDTGALCTRIAEQIRDTHDTLTDVGKEVSSQGVVASNIQTLVTGLHQFIFGEVRSFLADFGQLANKVFASTQQIYAVVLEIRDSRRALDTGWAFFQDPFVVEDAFGHKFPIPSEFDFDLLEHCIRHRFKEGAASQDVALGNYELLRSKERSSIITSTSQLLPGTSIVMVVIVRTGKEKLCPTPRCTSLQVLPCPDGGFTCYECEIWFEAIVRADKEKFCPMPRCTSVRALPCPGGGFTCSKCEVWFDQGTKRHRFSDVDEPSSSMASPSFNDPVRSPDRGVSDMEDRRSRSDHQKKQSFKNVKIAHLDFPTHARNKPRYLWPRPGQCRPEPSRGVASVPRAQAERPWYVTPQFSAAGRRCSRLCNTDCATEYIIDLYQPAYPNNHGFSILICRHVFDRSSSIPAAAALGRRNDRADEFIMIRAVTLSEPGTKKWTLVAESSRACFGIVPALQEFSKDLERQMGNMTASMTVDKKRQRNERDEGSIDQGEYMSGRSRKRQRERS